VIPRIAYNAILSCLGIGLTLSAASDFSSHARVTNAASGALYLEATVTVDEMLEHAFYHGINLFQIVFLHIVSDPPEVLAPLSLPAQFALVLLATSPWVVSSRFPVNAFSDNFNQAKTGEDPWTLIALLYRAKKTISSSTSTFSSTGSTSPSHSKALVVGPLVFRSRGSQAFNYISFRSTPLTSWNFSFRHS